MSKFTLTQRSIGPAKAKFSIVDSAGDSAGTIVVAASDVRDLLRCWNGPREPAGGGGAKPPKAKPPQSREEGAAAMARVLRPMSKDAARRAVLRSC